MPKASARIFRNSLSVPLAYTSCRGDSLTPRYRVADKPLVHLVLLILWPLGTQCAKRITGDPLQAGFSDDGDLSALDGIGDDIDMANLDVAETAPGETIPEYLPRDSANEMFAIDGTAIGTEPMDLDSLERIYSEPGDGLEALGSHSTGTATSGRNAAARRHGLPGREGDTTDASEAAVEAGLAGLRPTNFRTEAGHSI